MPTTIAAASPSQADVQAAVNAATDGDTVTIPNGSATWTSGITTTKQIIIRAQNYTSTNQGIGTTAATRNVTITNNSPSASTALIAMTTGNTANCGVGGIRFNEGTGNGPHIAIGGTGNKVPFIFDCYFENKNRFFPQGHCIDITCVGGVMWNCYGQGLFSTNSVGEGFVVIKLPGNSWATASSMGTLDVGGIKNFYVEDTTFHDVGLIDMDDNARLVVRHSLYDGSWSETHGFTSIWGGRHWELYDMKCTVTTLHKNISNRYFWCRAGTGIMTNCEVTSDPIASDFGGEPAILNIGDNTSPSGSYLIPRQPGCGHNGTTFVSDPIYIWNNTGTNAYNWGFQDAPGGWEAVVVQNRDIFVNNGAKPGYTKFTYPHPLRFDVGGPPPDTTPPAAPTNLRFT